VRPPVPALPWQTAPGAGMVFDANGTAVLMSLGRDTASGDQALRRVVACVNACEGIDTLALERYIVDGGADARMLSFFENARNIINDGE